MPNNHRLKIIDMQRHDTNGKVDVVKALRWEYEVDDGSPSPEFVKARKWVELDPPGHDFIPWPSVTENIALGWLRAHSDFDETQLGVDLDAALEKKLNPPIKNGLPW